MCVASWFGMDYEYALELLAGARLLLRSREEHGEKYDRLYRGCFVLGRRLGEVPFGGVDGEFDDFVRGLSSELNETVREADGHGGKVGGWVREVLGVQLSHRRAVWRSRSEAMEQLVVGAVG